VTVVPGSFARLCAHAKFGEHGLVEIAQAIGSFRIGAEAEKLLLEPKIGWQRCGELEGDRLVETELHGLHFEACQLKRFKVQRGALFSQCASRHVAFVFEKGDFGFEKGAGIFEHLDFESRISLAEDVEPSIIVAMGNANDLRGAADHGQAFLLRADNAEGGAVRNALSDHFLVSIFEDVQREDGSGKEHDVQREQGNFHGQLIMRAPVRKGADPLSLVLMCYQVHEELVSLQ
jgi:hypothetical protein